MIMETGKKLVLFAVVAVPVLFFGYQFWHFIGDQIMIRKVNYMIQWIGEYKSTHGEYPTKSEFDAKFPGFYKGFRVQESSQGYFPAYDASSFTLSYELYYKESNALGEPDNYNHDLSFFSSYQGSHTVTPEILKDKP